MCVPRTRERLLTRQTHTALLIVLYIVAHYPGAVHHAEQVQFALLPALQALAQGAPYAELLVAMPLIAFFSAGTSGAHNGAVSPLLLLNTLRAQLLPLVQRGERTAAGDMALASLAQGVPTGYELLPMLASPLLKLSYHADANVRRLSLLAMLEGLRSEWDALHATDPEARPALELAPVVVERLREMLHGSREAGDSAQGPACGSSPGEMYTDAGQSPSERHPAERHPGTLCAAVRTLRWVAAHYSELLSAAEALGMLQHAARIALPAHADTLLLATVAAARPLLESAPQDALAALEDLLVAVYAERGTEPPGGYALGLECARTLGALWRTNALPAPAARASARSEARVAQEARITRFLRAQLVTANCNTRYYVISVLAAWAPLGWMHATARGDALHELALSEEESAVLLAYTEDADAGVRAQVRLETRLPSHIRLTDAGSSSLPRGGLHIACTHASRHARGADHCIRVHTRAVRQRHGRTDRGGECRTTAMSSTTEKETKAPAAAEPAPENTESVKAGKARATEPSKEDDEDDEEDEEYNEEEDEDFVRCAAHGAHG